MRNKIVVAKEGYDAESDNNPSHLKFSSDYNTLKYFTQGTQELSITIPGNTSVPIQTETASVAHNLGYVPFFNVYAKLIAGGLVSASYASDMSQVPHYNDQNYEGENPNIFELEAFADTANIYFRFRRDADPTVDTTYTVRFYYRIFKNRLFT